MSNLVFLKISLKSLRDVISQKPLGQFPLGIYFEHFNQNYLHEFHEFNAILIFGSGRIGKITRFSENTIMENVFEKIM